MKKKKKVEKTPKKYTVVEWFSSYEYTESVKKRISEVVNDYTLMYCRVLQDNFNFDKNDLEIVVTKLNELCDHITDGNFTAADLRNSVYEELDVKVEVI